MIEVWDMLCSSVSCAFCMLVVGNVNGKGEEEELGRLMCIEICGMTFLSLYLTLFSLLFERSEVKNYARVDIHPVSHLPCHTFCNVYIPFMFNCGFICY